MENTLLNKDIFISLFYDNARPGVITDRYGKVIEINTSYTRITGYTKDEVMGRWGFIQADLFKPIFGDIEWSELEKENHWRGEIWEEKYDGEVFPQTLSISALYDNNKELTNYVAFYEDITSIIESEESFRKIAYYDNLTGLPNRMLLRERLQQSILQSKRNNTSVGLIILDIDSFKIINDTLGDKAGDRLLKQVSLRLQESIRQTDTMARMGGDEFAIVLTNLTKHQDITIVAVNLMTSLRKPFEIDGNELFVTASMGITTAPQDGEDVDDLIKRTDNAMYHAKDKGKNTFRFFSREMDSLAANRLNIETNLRRAIRNNEFELYYQPRVDLRTDKVSSAEALIRWNDPDEGVIQPLTFISIAEDTGLIVKIGEWVIEQACRDIRKWRDMGLPELKISVNVSARQFMDFSLSSKIEGMIRKCGIDAKNFEVEITESTLVKNIEFTTSMLKKLTDLGITIAIDDFGTGYSSMSYLKKLPFHVLKIDREFIKDLTEDSDDEEITKAIVALGKGLKLDIVAEGVETKQHYNILKKEGCTEAQGYFISKPVPAPDFEEFLKKYKHSWVVPVGDCEFID